MNVATPRQDPTRPRYSDEQVDDIVARRTVIEQAKGMLMYVVDVGPENAFALLKARSQSHNVKVHDLAAQILNDPSLIDEYWP